MRLTFISLAIGAFLLLSVIELTAGNLRVGVATACLAVANGLLLL